MMSSLISDDSGAMHEDEGASVGSPGNAASAAATTVAAPATTPPAAKATEETTAAIADEVSGVHSYDACLPWFSSFHCFCVQEAEVAALDLLPPTALAEALKIVSEIEASEANFTECVKNLRCILTSAGIGSKYDLNNKWTALKEQLKATYIANRSAHQLATHEAHVKAFNRVLNKVFPTQTELAQAIKDAAVDHQPTEIERGGIKANGAFLEHPFESDAPVSVIVPKPEPPELTAFGKFWKSLLSSKLSPATLKHAYGEFTVSSIWKVWFLINALVTITANDKVVDFGAGAGMQLWAVFFFASFRCPELVGVEVDFEAYKMLESNAGEFRKYVAAAQCCVNLTTIYGDSAKICDWSGCTIAIQYDGPTQPYNDISDYWPPVMRSLFTQPQMKVVFSTKMDEKTFNLLFNGDEKVFVGKWRVIHIAGLDQHGSSYGGYLWIRDFQESIPEVQRERVEKWSEEGQVSLETTVEAAASAPPPELQGRLAAGAARAAAEDREAAGGTFQRTERSADAWRTAHADEQASNWANPKRARTNPKPKFLGTKSAAALASSNPQELLAGLKSEIPAESWAKMMELQSE